MRALTLKLETALGILVKYVDPKNYEFIMKDTKTKIIPNYLHVLLTKNWGYQSRWLMRFQCHQSFIWNAFKRRNYTRLLCRSLIKFLFFLVLFKFLIIIFFFWNYTHWTKSIIIIWMLNYALELAGDWVFKRKKI